MAQKQQAAQQPSRKVGGQKEKRSWDTPSAPITPTPKPEQQPSKPEQQPSKPEQQPSKPEQQPDTGKK